MAGDAPLLVVLHGRDAVGPRELFPVVQSLGLRTLTIADDATTPAARACGILGHVVETGDWPAERVASLLDERGATGVMTFADGRLEGDRRARPTARAPRTSSRGGADRVEQAPSAGGTRTGRRRRNAVGTGRGRCRAASARRRVVPGRPEAGGRYQSGSSSMATTRLAAFASTSVMTPVPAPGSMTRSVGPTLAAVTKERTSAGLRRKFCPYARRRMSRSVRCEGHPRVSAPEARRALNSCLFSDGDLILWTPKMVPPPRPRHESVRFAVVGSQRQRAKTASWRDRSFDLARGSILEQSKLHQRSAGHPIVTPTHSPALSCSWMRPPSQSGR